MIKYYTLPGYGGSGSEHWQSFFDTKLDNCHRIEQDNWMAPVLEDWLERIEETLKNEDLSNTILITHSLGGVTLAHWVKKYGKKIKGALIVAPPDLEFPAEDLGVESFAPIPENKLPFPSIVVCSTNDDWMSVERAKYYAEAWGSELLTLENAGHVNGDSGYGDWDGGLEILKKLL